MDLISFEDFVVQPYNSYFNLEKELHDVKAKLSLMDQRLKYLEDKIGYGCKGNLTLEEKIDALDIKYEELDDEIEEDIKYINDRVKKLEEDKGKDNVKTRNVINYIPSKNIVNQSLRDVYIDSDGDIISDDEKYYGSLKNKMIDITLKYKIIDMMELQLFNGIDLDKLLRILKNTKILRLIICSYPKIQSVINLIQLHNIKVSYLEIENHLAKIEIENLQMYCNYNDIQFKVI